MTKNSTMIPVNGGATSMLRNLTNFSEVAWQIKDQISIDPEGNVPQVTEVNATISVKPHLSEDWREVNFIFVYFSLNLNLCCFAIVFLQ